MTKSISALFFSALLAQAAPLKFPIFSTFDGGADGWVSSSTAFQYFPRAGNPDGCIGLEDEGSDGNWAVAPAKFLGDWTSLDERGALFFDHKVYDPGTGVLTTFGYKVRITGTDGATAEWTAPGPTGATTWRSFRVPIRASKWVLSEGAGWAKLLQNVTKLEIKMEMFNNSGGTTLDKDAIDNVALAMVNQPCALRINMRPALSFITIKDRTYIIETSSDNENFTTLATITGTGNIVHYGDIRQLPKAQFYRLVCPE